MQRQASDDIVRASDVVEDVTVNSAEVSNKFKFFETYKAPEKEKKQFRITPPREGQVKVAELCFSFASAVSIWRTVCFCLSCVLVPVL